MAVGISSLEVVPFLLVLSLPKEHAEMGATSNVRNSQIYYLATETTEHLFFRWISH
ncbi:hypothetical protein [Clostridium sp. YIM B02569]|uniref:hypothetical protein n=1 Tax=Clostridium sp. YIM B02569 TaxID=2911967 RepID=UPI001EEEE7FC|nr:hypothetical protein [Clostridium sp. YIM B02569]